MRAPSAAVEVVEDLVYATPDGVELALDLYLPPGDGPFPTGIYLHGGGWVLGSRKDFSERPAAVAAEGIAVAAVSYRLSREATYPAQLEDVRAAAAWLRRNGARFGLATERIGAWGASAGGHLAALMALAPGATAATAVQAAVPWFATLDLTPEGSRITPAPGLAPPSFLLEAELPDGLSMPLVPPPEPRLLGVADVAEVPGLAREASPISHASASSPPLLLCHGDADGIVAVDHSVRMHEAMIGAGGRSTLLIVAGANHEDEHFLEPAVIGATATFLRTHLASPS